MINSNKKFISGHNKSQLGKKKLKLKLKNEEKILRSILQYDLNNNLINEWDGIIDAANKLN